MRPKRALSFNFPVLALLVATGCGGSGGSDNDSPHDAEDPYNDPGNITEIFPFAPATPSGTLKDNLAGAWLVTTEYFAADQTSTEPATAPVYISGGIVSIRPDTISFSEIDAGLWFPASMIPPDSIWAPIGDCGSTIKFIIMSNDAAATQATIHMDEGGTHVFSIVSDTRMEAETPEYKTVWQKIDVPVDEHENPVLGTVTYDAVVDDVSVSGTASVYCLSQSGQTFPANAATYRLEMGFADAAKWSSDKFGTFTIDISHAPPGSVVVSASIRHRASSASISRVLSANLEDIFVPTGSSTLDALDINVDNSTNHLSFSWRLNN